MEQNTKNTIVFVLIFLLALGIAFIFLKVNNDLKTSPVKQDISPEFVCQHLQAPNSSVFPDLSEHIYNLVVNDSNVTQVGYTSGTATHWIVSPDSKIIGLNCELNLVFCQKLNNSNLYCNPLKDEFFEVSPTRWSNWYGGIKWTLN